MKKQLPVRPSLEHLEAQAKDLLGALQRGERAALERFQRGLPAARGKNLEQVAALGLALHDAQSVLAREYGHPSWTELRAAVETAGSPEPAEDALSPEALSPEALSPEALRALLRGAGREPPPAAVEQALLEASARPVRAAALPAQLPLVAVRDALVSAGATAPLLIARPSSLAAVARARQGDGLLVLFSQKNEQLEQPGAEDLHPVGCVAELCAEIAGDAEAGSWVVLRGLDWVRLERLAPAGGLLLASVARFEVDEASNPEARQLEAELRSRVSAIVATLPNPEHVRQLTGRMSALQLADSTLANLQASTLAKAGYASEPTLVGRLRQVLALLDAQTAAQG